MRRDRSRYLANGKPSCRVNCRWPRGECPDHPLPVVIPPGVFADPRSFEHIEVGAEYPICPVCHYQRCSCPPPLGWHEKKWASGIRGFERDDNRGAVWPEIPSPKPTWGCGPSPELGKDNYSSTLAWGRTGLKASAEAMAFVDEQLKAEDEKKKHPIGVGITPLGYPAIGTGVTSSPSVGSGVTSSVTKSHVDQTLHLRAGWHVTISKNWDFGSGFERDDRRAVVYFNRYLDMWTVAPAVPNTTECCYSSQEPGARTDLPSAEKAMDYADAKLLETETVVPSECTSSLGHLMGLQSARNKPAPLRSGWHVWRYKHYQRDDKRAAVWLVGSNEWGCGPDSESVASGWNHTWRRYGFPSEEKAMEYADEMLRLEDAKKRLDVSKKVPAVPSVCEAPITSENLWSDLAKAQAKTTPQFKVGDLVKCMRFPKEYMDPKTHGLFALGRVYRVNRVHDDAPPHCISVDGLDGSFLNGRFDLVAPDEAPPDWERVDAETYRHKSGWNVLRTSTGLWLLWSGGTARPVGKNRSTMHEAMAALSSLTDVCNLWNGATRQASKPV